MSQQRFWQLTKWGSLKAPGLQCCIAALLFIVAFCKVNTFSYFAGKGGTCSCYRSDIDAQPEGFQGKKPSFYSTIELNQYIADSCVMP